MKFFESILGKQKAGNVLVLGGGAVRGLAHIGVLKAIEEKGIEVDVVVGCSMGSIIGSLYAMGFSPEGMESFVRTLSKDRKGLGEYIRILPSATSIADSSKIDELLRRVYGDIEFGDLKLPLYVNAADILNMEYVVFHRGLVRTAVRASISIPGLFDPVRMGNRLLVDGGVIETVPVSIAHMLDPSRIIAVNVLNRKELRPHREEAIEIKRENPPGLLDLLRSGIEEIRENNIFSISVRSLRLMQMSQVEMAHRISRADIWIDVEMDVDPLDFSGADVEEIIDAGYRAAMKSLK